MRIASFEQVELGNIMELSVTVHVLKWNRQSNFSEVDEQSRGMKPEEPLSSDSCRAVA